MSCNDQGRHGRTSEEDWRRLGSERVGSNTSSTTQNAALPCSSWYPYFFIDRDPKAGAAARAGVIERGHPDHCIGRVEFGRLLQDDVLVFAEEAAKPRSLIRKDSVALTDDVGLWFERRRNAGRWLPTTICRKRTPCR